ncbi:putative metabolite transport protein YyaJ [Pullulanibacillus camelliae]|uniref:Putative metabolite transport protein YyaJ n=1 Tax=Pullulanibacillus camelliae TaxID=1707096 RepID=A0A8J2VNM1_9BACL|nr:MFS transporter [Pullulanibacillus camelliae]GGE33080.1 putative metabolite transport protein YyaJ [Pullulanibacillus camelliae]
MSIQQNVSDINNKVGLNIPNRMDRLPIFSFHRTALFTLAFIYFFEFADLNTFSFAAPALISSWGLSVSTVAVITSSTFLGMFIGATVGGWFADRLGRKKALIISGTFFSLFSILNALAWDPISLGVFRCLTGVGLSALTVVANTYISEVFPSSVRGRYQGLCVTVGLIGIPITSFISSQLVPLASWGWRLVFVWGAVGILFLFFMPKFMESPRWLEKRGRFEEAETVMHSIEAQAEKAKGRLEKPEAPVQQIRVKSSSFTELFKRKHIKLTLILVLVWIFQTFGFYGFGSWVPTLLSKQGIDLSNTLIYSTLITVGAPLGAFTGSLFSDKLERKWIITISSIVIALCGLLYGLTLVPFMIILFGFLVNFIERIFSSNLYAYSAEVFSTEARASGSGLSYGVGRLFNTIGPLFIGAIYTGLGYISVFIFIALCWLAVTLIIGLFGARTSKQHLETIHMS